MKQTAKMVIADLKAVSQPDRIPDYQRFFKTGPGEYGEGDIFMGVMVPKVRAVVRTYKDLPFSEIKKLMHSRIHEVRLCGILILVSQYERGDEATKKNTYDYYLANTKCINNWDLVDLSAHKIVGAYLVTRSRAILKKLAKSKSLWERRIAIISTFAFMRGSELEPSYTIAKMLLNDKHDLIHKAVGWVLREAGKLDMTALELFLQTHYDRLPRTTLRYAIEKFPEKKRKVYLKGVFDR